MNICSTKDFCYQDFPLLAYNAIINQRDTRLILVRLLKRQATLTNGLVDFLPPWPLGLQRAFL